MFYFHLLPIESKSTLFRNKYNGYDSQFKLYDTYFIIFQTIIPNSSSLYLFHSKA